MVTLLQAQKTLNADPVVGLTVGSTDLGAYVGRYKYRDKADSHGRCSIWLDNSGGTFNSLSGQWSDISRGAAAVLSRGYRVDGQELTQALPTVWIETINYVYFREQPFLVLDCINWVGRLRYFRYDGYQTWSNALVETIVSDILGQVGLTLQSGSFSDGLTIDYTLSPFRSGWSAIRELMSKVPEVLYAKPGTEIGWKALDSGDSSSYSYAYNPTSGGGHPLLDDTDVAESSARYNWIKVRSDTNETYVGTATNTAEYNKLGYYRRRTITDRTLGSNAECAARAAAELEFWKARAVAGVIVARPHCTVKLFDVVDVPAPLWGGPAVGAGHVTRIVEWYNYAGRLFDQALTIGEVPDAAIAHLDDDDEEPIPDDDDPGDSGDDEDGGSTDDIDATVGSDDIDDGAVDTIHLADGSVTTAKLASDAVTGAKIADDAVDSEHIADQAVLQSRIKDGAVNNDKLADNSVSNAKMQNDAIGTAEIQNDAVTAAKIASDVAGSGLSQAAGGALDVAVDDSTLAVTADVVHIKADGVNSDQIADGAVDPVHLSQWPKVRAYQSTSDQTISQSSEDPVYWNAETYDTGSMHANSPNPARLTAPSAGDYEIYCQLYLNLQGGTGGQAVITIEVNGLTEYAVTNNGWTLDDTENTFVISDVLVLAANDYVRILVENTDTTGNDIIVKAGEGRSFCVMRRVP